MPDFVLPTLGSMSPTEAIAQAQSIFRDGRIAWTPTYTNAATQETKIIGTVYGSVNSVIVDVSLRSVVAYYLNNGATVATSRPLGSVSAACEELKRLIEKDTQPFAN